MKWLTKLFERHYKSRQTKKVARLSEQFIPLFPNDTERTAFISFLDEHPELSTRLQKINYLSYEPTDPIARRDVAFLLVSYGQAMAESGDFFAATGSLLYSLVILEENPLAWATMAEVYLAANDRIAARWAKKLLDFKPLRSPSELINKIYSDTAILATLQDMKERMKLIIEVCSEHPEWRDSYPLKRTISIYQDL